VACHYKGCALETALHAADLSTDAEVLRYLRADGYKTTSSLAAAKTQFKRILTEKSF
jgi:hypothetical protein